MKKTLQSGVAIATMLLATSVAVQAKDTAEETRDVGEFDELFLKGSMDVEVKVGEKQSVRVVADSDIIEHIETEVRGEELHISLERGHYRKIKKMTVYVTVPSLKAAGVNGSGDLLVENAKADDFDLELHGSGDAVFKDATFGDLEIELQGSGDIEIDGVCENVEIELQGSGDVDADDLKCDTAEVTLQGSGDIEVYARSEADVSVHGSGDVVIAGEPGKVRSRVHGSGDIEIQ